MKYYHKQMLWLNLFLIVILATPSQYVYGQEATPDYPVYIVAEGDNMWRIAQQFSITIDDLTKANNISDPNQLTVGMELKVPGLQGIKGTLITQKLPFGENLRSLSRRYRVSQDALARLNRVVNPSSALYAGANLILIKGLEKSQQTNGTTAKRALLLRGESLLELAVIQNTNPWTIMGINQIDNTWQSMPEDILQLSGQNTQGPGALPGFVEKVTILPEPLGQGKTGTIRLSIDTSSVQLPNDFITGTLAGQKLNFFPLTDNNTSSKSTEFISLQGLHNSLEPGYYPLKLTFNTGNDNIYSYDQSIFIQDSKFVYEKLNVTDETLLDPKIAKPEEQQIAGLTSKITAQKFWNGKFKNPVDKEYIDCWPSTYGRRRSYNGSGFTYIHTGLDFCGQEGFKIYAPGAGKIIFTGKLDVRGNTTIIDHGWGIYSMYCHQSEIKTKLGDMVEPNQIIGLIGKTGRVTGPHLHWEIWVGGIQVDPYDWLLNEYPQLSKEE